MSAHETITPEMHDDCTIFTYCILGNHSQVAKAATSLGNQQESGPPLYLYIHSVQQVIGASLTLLHKGFVK